MNRSGPNVSTDRRNFFMSSAQLEALERKEEMERDPVRQKLGSPFRASGRILNFSLCGRNTCVLALASHSARVLDLETNSIAKGLVKHTGPVTCVGSLSERYLIDGSRVAVSGSWDKIVKVWLVNDPQHVLGTLTGHIDFIKCLLVHPTEPIIYTGSSDNSIIIWELPDPSELAQNSNTIIKPRTIIHNGHSSQVRALCLDPTNAEVLYSVGSDVSIRAWDAMSGKSIMVDNGEDGSIPWEIPRGQHQTNILDVAASGYNLWTASADKTAVGWDIESRTAETVLKHKAHVTAVLPIPQVGVVITGTADGIIYVWRTSSGSPEIIREIHAHTDDISCLRLSGRVFYSSGLDETLRVWDIKDVVDFSGGLSYIPPEIAILANKSQADATKSQTNGNATQSSTMLTEDEERELAELMSDIDEM